MSSDYQAVQKALGGGASPAMLCATCPWDRNCVTPPEMTSTEIDQRMQEMAAQDEARLAQARAAGTEPGLPTATLLGAVIYAGKDTAAQVCPVFALRLKSSSGRKMADEFRNLMQGWDDQS